MANNYVVTGGGRTGSHWVEQIVKFIQPTSEVIHTNELEYFDQITDHVIVVSWRRDVFAAVVSFFVAQHTDEWFAYSDSKFEPFDIDQERFQQKIIDTEIWKRRFNQEVRPRCKTVVDIWFEDLVSATVPEKYISKSLGLSIEVPTKEWTLNKNPRNYTSLIKNYAELQDIFLKNQRLSN